MTSLLTITIGIQVVYISKHCIEEPDIQLKQAVREMQFELYQEEQRLALMQHELARLDQKAQQLKQKVVNFNEELDICFTANKDDLARDLIKRKLEAKVQLETATNQYSDLQKTAQALNVQIEEYAQTRRRARQDLIRVPATLDRWEAK